MQLTILEMNYRKLRTIKLKLALEKSSNIYVGITQKKGEWKKCLNLLCHHFGSSQLQLTQFALIPWVGEKGIKMKKGKEKESRKSKERKKETMKEENKVKEEKKDKFI